MRPTAVFTTLLFLASSHPVHTLCENVFSAVSYFRLLLSGHVNILTLLAVVLVGVKGISRFSFTVYLVCDVPPSLPFCVDGRPGAFKTTCWTNLEDASHPDKQEDASHPDKQEDASHLNDKSPATCSSSRQTPALTATVNNHLDNFR